MPHYSQYWIGKCKKKGDIFLIHSLALRCIHETLQQSLWVNDIIISFSIQTQINYHNIHRGSFYKKSMTHNEKSSSKIIIKSIY